MPPPHPSHLPISERLCIRAGGRGDKAEAGGGGWRRGQGHTNWDPAINPLAMWSGPADSMWMECWSEVFHCWARGPLTIKVIQRAPGMQLWRSGQVSYLWKMSYSLVSFQVPWQLHSPPAFVCRRAKTGSKLRERARDAVVSAHVDLLNHLVWGASQEGNQVWLPFTQNPLQKPTHLNKHACRAIPLCVTPERQFTSSSSSLILTNKRSVALTTDPRPEWVRKANTEKTFLQSLFLILWTLLGWK